MSVEFAAPVYTFCLFNSSLVEFAAPVYTFCLLNSSLVRWGTPGNFSYHGEHPGGVKTESKQWNISRKYSPLKE